ncbi:hypothetical protein K435DRAFT_665258 [Dendrothele bispora CBS 962.96]|uniref:Histone chaperone RTT106/FACT complex subunit SPT16-like middle domain-containing protein n=1 Tax=Dendrothele bispora (strain CBS 962.96) TaxID=1314807 RepID=A0A4S8M1N4_DENBC|nr:hypothetical protein K435DRAFT_665258 [Dendrothele bispora CBS 962.96]
MDSKTPFLHVVTTCLPENMSGALQQLCSSPTNELLLENLIRFISGAEHSSHSSSENGWADKQGIVRARLAELSTNGNNKRQREDADNQGSNKRLKADVNTSNDAEDEPSLFTLHAISATSPVRKKVDITIHQTVIKLYHPTSHAVEATVPLSSLRRGFVVPTRGKTKPHWTVILISTDVPEKEKGKAAASSQNNRQIIFGIDAVATSPFSATDSNGTTLSIKKGDETLPTIRLFLSHLGFPIYEPSVNVFKSALPGNAPDGVPGVEAYRGAKAGNLWFMSEGILWGESKPCEFFAAENLINKDEGLRMMSATGRTMTLIVVRKSKESELAEGEEDMGEESQFSLIDGKEQDGINRWIKNHRHLFGGSKSGGVAGPTTISQMIMDSDDEEDGDFAMKSDDDDSGGSGASDEDGDGDGDDKQDADGDSDEEEAAGSDDEEVEQDEDGEEDLKAENHPLLRPGAMPRMSRAAVDMVVGMVTDDLTRPGEAEEDELLDD